MNAPYSVAAASSAGQASQLLADYRSVRSTTAALAARLSAEDCQAQSMPDASPVKWHLAHTTWFFETFVLGEFAPGYRPAFTSYRVLFNSYYNAVGQKHPRAERGLLTRPSLAEVTAYRRAVDDAIAGLISEGTGSVAHDAALRTILILGLNHEQQHQELILTDVKHLLSCNPLGPAYCVPESGLARSSPPSASAQIRTSEATRVSPDSPAAPGGSEASAFRRFDGGIVSIGHDGSGFAFDNEGPAHEVLLQPFELAQRLVTCAEFLEFVADGGYQRPELWLSMGWDRVQSESWQLPMYWRSVAGQAVAQSGEQALAGPREHALAQACAAVEHFTLHGWQPLDPAAPVAHLSLFEADAYARWSDARLPTEAEWEHAARQDLGEGGGDPQSGRDGAAAAANLLERGALRPLPARAAEHNGRLQQLRGDLWEWTSSSYGPYPGFRASADAVGEYNGKFMCNQYVLRGGSFATPRSHLRASYRNFFPPEARWQFTGLRLAHDSAPSMTACPPDRRR